MPLSIPPISSSATFVGAKAYADSTQSITGGSFIAMTFNLEEFDTDGFHDTSSNTSRMTVPAGKGGKYLLQAGCFHDAAISWIGFRSNGSTILRGYSAANAAAGYHAHGIITSLVANDYVEAGVASTSANVGHASLPDAQKWFSIAYLGA